MTKRVASNSWEGVAAAGESGYSILRDRSRADWDDSVLLLVI